MNIQDLINQNVTLYSQCNNINNPNGACFNTSAAMGIEALGGSLTAEGEQLAEIEHSWRHSDIPYSDVKLDDKIWLLCNREDTIQAVADAQTTAENRNFILNYYKNQKNELFAIEEYVVNHYVTGVNASIDWCVGEEDLAMNAASLNEVIVLGTKLYAGHMICVFGIENRKLTVGDPYGNYFEGLSATWGSYPLDWQPLRGCIGLVLKRA